MKTDNMVWTVLGGWAVPPAVLESIFGKNSNYIDINPLIPSLFDKGTLVPDWIQRLKYPEPGCLCLFILQDGQQGQYYPYPGICAQPGDTGTLSATHTFCRKTISVSVPGSVLESMRTSLAVDRKTCLKDFTPVAAWTESYILFHIRPQNSKRDYDSRTSGFFH